MRLLELDRLDWDRIRRRNPKARVLCSGRLKANPCQPLLFVCRSDMATLGGKRHRGFACGRRCCACEGGDDNRCSACYNKLARRIEKRAKGAKR